MRPFRSVLYLPAANPRALEKAATLPVDAVILDLEDAVAPAEKPRAREALAAGLDRDWGRRVRIVRVNALDTEWGEADARAAAAAGADALLLPKVDGPAALDRLAEIAPGRPLWAMLETAAGVMNAAAIAAHPALEGIVAGTNDLAAELRLRPRPDRLGLLPSLGLMLLAARRHERVIVDGVYNAFRDEAGLAAECAQGRDLGFDGKTLIHPAQIAAANAAFAPEAEELALARRQIEAFAEAEAAGQGVAVLDGRIVENLHVAAARRLLAQAEAIAAAAG